MRRVQAEDLLRASRRLGEAALDPALWPAVMEDVCAAAGATGAVLLQSDGRGPETPATPSLAELGKAYFGGGWHTPGRDLRARRGIPLALRGEVFTDQDLVTPEEMRREPYYNEFVFPSGFHWFAGIGFRAGSALWALTMQRTAHEGRFEAADKAALATLAAPLTEAATLAAAVGRSVLSGIADALGLVGQPAILLDSMGAAVHWNGAADRLFGDEIRVSHRRLVVAGDRARAALARLVDRLRATADTAALPVEPIVVERAGKRPVVIRPLPIPGAARGPFLGARALLILTDLGRQPAPEPRLIRDAFGLTAAEGRLAAALSAGAALNEAASGLGISRDTARNQLKSIFGKTDTHRQSELLMLLGQLRAAGPA